MAHTAWLRIIKIQALEKQKGQCCYCYSNLSIRQATAEHVVPLAKGGTDRKSNIKASCRDCNEAKSDMNEAAFIKIIKYPENQPLRFWLIYSRRKINLATNRSVNRMCKLFGI